MSNNEEIELRVQLSLLADCALVEFAESAEQIRISIPELREFADNYTSKVRSRSEQSSDSVGIPSKEEVEVEGKGETREGEVIPLEQILEPCKIDQAIRAVEEFKNAWQKQNLTAFEKTILIAIEAGLDNTQINQKYGVAFYRINGLRKLI